MPTPPRLTQTLSALTTRIFRCRGLEPQPLRDEREGAHDALLVLLSVLLLAGWYYFCFEPLRERNAMLAGRLDVLRAQQRAEERELARLKRETEQLASGDPLAWERAARARLGWLRPGEVVDLAGGRRSGGKAGNGRRASETARAPGAVRIPPGPRSAPPDTAPVPASARGPNP